MERYDRAHPGELPPGLIGQPTAAKVPSVLKMAESMGGSAHQPVVRRVPPPAEPPVDKRKPPHKKKPVHTAARPVSGASTSPSIASFPAVAATATPPPSSGPRLNGASSSPSEFVSAAQPPEIPLFSALPDALFEGETAHGVSALRLPTDGTAPAGRDGTGLVHKGVEHGYQPCGTRPSIRIGHTKGRGLEFYWSFLSFCLTRSPSSANRRSEQLRDDRHPRTNNPYLSHRTCGNISHARPYNGPSISNFTFILLRLSLKPSDGRLGNTTRNRGRKWYY